MSGGEPDAAALMDALRDDYLSQVGGVVADLRPHVLGSDATQHADGRTAAGVRAAHNLAGTGATYGYPEITDAARALEHGLAQTGTTAVVEEAFRALDAAWRNARASRPRSAAGSAGRPDGEGLAAGSGQGGPARPTLLIADDDTAIRGLAAAIFAADARVLTASGGLEALRLLRSEEPDLVLLDDEMPDLKGTAILETMAAEDRFGRSAAIMLTANNDSSVIARAIALGAADYVMKPFQPLALATRVRKVLEGIRTTVLVADDDPAVRSLVSTKLRLAGLRVLVTDNGTDALNKIRERRPRLAILDRMMPGEDGLATLLAIRSDPDLAQTPVVILSARRHERDIVEGLQCGANDYIAKPFSPDELLVRCQRLLRSSG